MLFIEVTTLDGHTFAFRPDALKSIQKGEDGKAAIGIMHGVGHAADIALDITYEDLLAVLKSAEIEFDLRLIN